MPNHIITSVEIKGSKEQLEKLIKDTKLQTKTSFEVIDEGNKFDFNGIIPMPEELNITSGSSTSIGKIAHSQSGYERSSLPQMPWWSERYKGVTDAASLKKFLEGSDSESDKQALREGAQALENVKKYGHESWYDWCVANWGTKWNAYNVHYIAHDDTHLVLDITTAWDTPRGIWEALQEQGFEVNGIMHGEMDGTDIIGDGGPFYVNIEVEFNNEY